VISARSSSTRQDARDEGLAVAIPETMGCTSIAHRVTDERRSALRGYVVITWR